MKRILNLLVIASIPTFITPTLFAGESVRYNIDPSHSSIEFSIRHFVAKTNGNFSEFTGFIDIDVAHPEDNYAEASISIPSIDTNSDKRDAHLQQDDYFNSEKHPFISFKSTKWEQTEKENHYVVSGDLSMNNITNPILMNVELLGMGPGMHGRYLSGWEGKTTIDRTDWNINGGIGAVGEIVEIRINIEAIREEVANPLTD